MLRVKRPAAYHLDTTALVLDKDGEEHEIEITVWFDATYQAAYTSGPPENCYPEDSELEIVSVIVDTTDLPLGVSAGQVIEAAFDDEDVQQKCWDEYFDQRNER